MCYCHKLIYLALYVREGKDEEKERALTKHVCTCLGERKWGKQGEEHTSSFLTCKEHAWRDRRVTEGQRDGSARKRTCLRKCGDLGLKLGMQLNVKGKN